MQQARLVVRSILTGRRDAEGDGTVIRGLAA